MSEASDGGILGQWKKTIEFYKDLIEVHKWQQKPMLDLVVTLSKKDMGTKVYPSTSHESLGLCEKESFEKRLTAPMVYLTYVASKDEFEIRFQRGQGNTITTKNADRINENEILDIISWIQK